MKVFFLHQKLYAKSKNLRNQGDPLDSSSYPPNDLKVSLIHFRNSLQHVQAAEGERLTLGPGDKVLDANSIFSAVRYGILNGELYITIRILNTFCVV